MKFYGYNRIIKSHHYDKEETYYFVSKTGTIYIAPLESKYYNEKHNIQTSQMIENKIKKSNSQKLGKKPKIENNEIEEEYQNYKNLGIIKTTGTLRLIVKLFPMVFDSYLSSTKFN